MATHSAILGVGGGIAAYKAAELARALMERDFGVTTVMTDAAQQFVRPLTFAALTGRKVLTGMFDTPDPEINHIQLTREHDVLVVAPATADLLAKFAHGLAGDFLSTLYLAFSGPVVLAPAMNTAMWLHPATQANLEILRQRGHLIIEPDSGPLACGTEGAGRLPEPHRIADFVLRALTQRHDLDNETVLITAGPTREPLDPVRFISNRSSGKMGYALAEAAAARGAKVTLVSGPVAIGRPEGVELIPVQTAIEMRQAVLDHLADADIVIKAAAVADYYVARTPKQKVKKTAMRMSLELDPTPDILAEVGAEIARTAGHQLLIGFAAETENVVAEARRKLNAKHCDMVVANDVSGPATGFDSDDNEVVLVDRTGAVKSLERASKRVLADRILDAAIALRLALHGER